MQGPPGIQGQQGAPGERGAPGRDGVDGRDGRDGTSVHINGTLHNAQELPVSGAPGDSWLIEGDLWIWAANESRWQNVGRIQGPSGTNGESPYQVARRHSPAMPMGEAEFNAALASLSNLSLFLDKIIGGN